jgi:hypothetical protein
MGWSLHKLFASDLMPHGACWGWEPWAVWTNVIPDAVIALSCLALSVNLVHLIRRRRELRPGCPGRAVKAPGWPSLRN